MNVKNIIFVPLFKLWLNIGDGLGILYILRHLSIQGWLLIWPSCPNDTKWIIERNSVPSLAWLWHRDRLIWRLDWNQIQPYARFTLSQGRNSSWWSVLCRSEIYYFLRCSFVWTDFLKNILTICSFNLQKGILRICVFKHDTWDWTWVHYIKQLMNTLGIICELFNAWD